MLVFLLFLVLQGVEKIIEFELIAEEKALLDNSVNAVKTLVTDMERLGF